MRVWRRSRAARHRGWRPRPAARRSAREPGPARRASRSYPRARRVSGQDRRGQHERRVAGRGPAGRTARRCCRRSNGRPIVCVTAAPAPGRRSAAASLGARDRPCMQRGPAARLRSRPSQMRFSIGPARHRPGAGLLDHADHDEACARTLTVLTGRSGPNWPARTCPACRRPAAVPVLPPMLVLRYEEPEVGERARDGVAAA